MNSKGKKSFDCKEFHQIMLKFSIIVNFHYRIKSNVLVINQKKYNIFIYLVQNLKIKIEKTILCIWS